MQKTKKKYAVFALILACLACMLGAFLSFRQTTKVALAKANNDIEEAFDRADVKILDGARLSTSTPYVIAWDISINEDDYNEINNAINSGYASAKNDYYYLMHSQVFCYGELWLFDEATIPSLSVGLNNVGYYFGMVGDNSHPLTALKTIHFDYGIEINGDKFSPDYKIKLNQKTLSPDGNGNLVSHISVNVGRNNVHKTYVPMFVFIGGYVTVGLGGSGASAPTGGTVVYNPNAVRSVSQVANRYWEMNGENINEENDPVEYKVMLENLEGSQILDNLKSNELIEGLEAGSPLNLEIIPGATYDADVNGIQWKCTFNIANFQAWRNSIEHLSVWWIVLEYDEYLSSGNVAIDFNYNYAAALRVYPEVAYYEDGQKYVSEITFVPEDDQTYYIAIPFIKVVGVKAPVATAYRIPFEGVAAGTYILTDNIDNARSIESLLGINEDTVYTYSFEYLRPYEDRPFALRETKTITKSTRIDFSKMDMEDYAKLLDLDVNDKGQISCLLSIVNFWFINQQTASSYSIHAMYSIIPFTIKNDFGQTDVLYLGLIPFDNIDGTDEYAKLLTSLRDKDGHPYFSNPNEVAVSDVYGYFYTYSYKSEQSKPNWTLDQDQYTGAISYFAQCTGSKYNRGYVEIGSYGAIVGGIAGAVVGTVIAPGLGTVIGAAVGAGAGYLLSASAAKFFGCKQDSTTTYYYVEYGFLDGTTMTPEAFFKLQKDPEMTMIEKVVFAVAILMELFAVMWAWNKFKGAPFWLQIILFSAFVGLLVYGDILLWQFFLTG